MFDFMIGKSPINENGEMILPSKIIIDDYSESINIPISYWDINMYKNSWRKSIEEGLKSRTHSALIISMYEPTSLNFVFVWVLYFAIDQVYIQNSIVFVDECIDFDVTKINQFIQPRETHNEDGLKISEWHTDLSGVLDFYNRL